MRDLLKFNGLAALGSPRSIKLSICGARLLQPACYTFVILIKKTKLAGNPFVAEQTVFGNFRTVNLLNP
jgi:hypothetical protein